MLIKQCPNTGLYYIYADYTTWPDRVMYLSLFLFCPKTLELFWLRGLGPEECPRIKTLSSVVEKTRNFEAKLEPMPQYVVNSLEEYILRMRKKPRTGRWKRFVELTNGVL